MKSSTSELGLRMLKMRKLLCFQPTRKVRFKVTVYLQGCLTSKRCSAFGLSCRYLNPYIKLKLIELAIKPYQKF